MHSLHCHLSPISGQFRCKCLRNITLDEDLMVEYRPLCRCSCGTPPVDRHRRVYDELNLDLCHTAQNWDLLKLPHFAIDGYSSNLSEDSANTTNNYRPINSLIKNIDRISENGKTGRFDELSWGMCDFMLYTSLNVISCDMRVSTNVFDNSSDISVTNTNIMSC